MKAWMILGLVASTSAQAQLKTFTPNTPISAAEMNANFLQLQNAISGLTSGGVGPSSIDTTHIIDATILGTDISTNAISSSHIVDGSITAADLSGVTFEAPLSFTASLTRLTNSISLPQASGSVDGYLSSSAYNTFNNKMDASGGSLTGHLTLHADPTSTMHAATKNYVDNTAVVKTGTSMTGYLTLFADPTIAMHAASKNYVDTKAVAIGGNSVTTNLSLGTTSPHAVYIKSNSSTLMTFDPSGGVAIGTVTPDSNTTLHVLDGNSTSAGTSALLVEAYNNASGGGAQYGMMVRSNVFQTGSASYTALKVFAQESTLGTGDHKLLELSTGTTNLSVDSKGYIRSPGDFMASLTTDLTRTCVPSPTMPTDFSTVTSVNMDFGVNNGGVFVVSMQGPFEIILDAPSTGGSSSDELIFVLYNTNTNQQIRIHPGTSIKRLSTGSWELRIGCDSSTGTRVFTAANFIFGIRKFH